MSIEGTTPVAAARQLRNAPAPRTVLAVASLGAAVAFVDATIVNIAFPNIEGSFKGTSISTLSWVLNAYNIVFASFLVAAGRIADLLGRRRLFVLGLELFTFASLLCAIAPSPAALVAFRVLQALGAACLVPASLALVLNAFPPERRAHGVALLSAVAAAAAGLGPSLGGLLVRRQLAPGVPRQHSDRRGRRDRAGPRRLIESRAPGRRRIPDSPVRCCSRSRSDRSCWGSCRASGGVGAARACIASFAAAVVLGAVFVRRCAVHRSPMIDLSLLRVRTFATRTR